MGDQSKAKERGELFTRIVLDQRISHGAFRFWHLLNTKFAGKRRACWPGQRNIQKLLGCSKKMLKPWRKQLVAAGYLRLEDYSKDKHPFVKYKDYPPEWVYFIEDGSGSTSDTTLSGSTITMEVVLQVIPESGSTSRTETNSIGTNSKELSTLKPKNFRSWGNK